MATTESAKIAAGTWDIDPVRSSVSFTVRHMMFSKVRGRFGSFTGEIKTGSDFLDSSVTASIDTASLDTGDSQRDGHVRNADLLDTANHPTMTYRSTGIRANGACYVVDGELTLHGVIKSVPLSVRVTGSGPDDYGGTWVGFSASATINRNDFGVDLKLPLGGGGMVLSDKVQIELDIQGVLRKDRRG
jgi:polyisoprenoid-binding protein YceI